MNRNLVTATITICAVCLLIAASLSFSGFFEQISHDIYNPEKNKEDISTNPGKVTESEVPSVQPGNQTENTTEMIPVSETNKPDDQQIKSPSEASKTVNTNASSNSLEQTGENANAHKDVIDGETLAIQLWLEQKIEEHKDEIEDEDLADFKSIIKKLDQPFIKKLSIDGFDIEEQELLKKHLNERLTQSECERAKGLFFKYSFLLEDI
jgi:hypothetical protein